MAIHSKASNSSPKRDLIWVIVLAGLLLTITLLVAFGFYVIKKNQTVISPLKSSIQHLRMEFEEMHQWIPNMPTSRSPVNLEYAWFELDLTVTEFRQLLEGNDHDPRETIRSGLYNKLELRLKALDTDITAYKRIVESILKPTVQSDKTPAEGLHYDQIYGTIQVELNEMEGTLNGFLQQDLSFFRRLIFGGVIICLLLVALSAITYGHFLKQKTEDYATLTAMHEN